MTMQIQMQGKLGSVFNGWLSSVLTVSEPSMWLLHADGRWVGCVQRDPGGLRVEWLSTAPPALHGLSIVAPDLEQIVAKVRAAGAGREIWTEALSD